MQVSISMDGTKRKKLKVGDKKRNHRYRQSVGDDLEVVEADKVTKTNADENKHRRTIVLEKAGDSWGFTIQSYGIHHQEDDEVELLTYVDYVAYGGPAYLAGMRPGDVILSIDGTNMEDADHVALVQFIRKCSSTMRMVVLYEDCCRKVDLHLRYLKLKRVLAEKIFEMRSLEQQEMRIMAGLSRFDSCRSSRASSSSSMNSFWDDRLSLVPELDRCPTPRNSSRMSLTQGRSVTPTLSPQAGFTPRFDFERSSLPVTKCRPNSLAVSASMNAALQASLSQKCGMNGASCSSLDDSRPRSLHLEIPPILEFGSKRGRDRSPGLSPRHRRHHHSDNQRHHHSDNHHRKNHFLTSTPDYKLPPPGGSLHHSHLSASAPDGLVSQTPDSLDAMEMEVFKLSLAGVDVTETTTENETNVDVNNKVLTKVQIHSASNGHLSPVRSSLPELQTPETSQGSVSSANMSGALSSCSSVSSVHFQIDSPLRSSSPYSDADTPELTDVCSESSNMSDRDIPSIEVEFINEDSETSRL